jgi:hypothetical protein
MSYTPIMRLWPEFRLFYVLRAVASALLPALALAFAFGGGGGAAASPPAAAFGTHAGATLGEAPLAVRLAAPRAPGRPAPCLDRYHPCGPGVIPAAHGEPFSVGSARRLSVAAPRGPAQVPAPVAVPHLTTSLSILFRNFRN